MKKIGFKSEKLSSIFKDGFIKNIFVLATGTASVQVLNFALTPLITRLYSAEAFGSLGLFSTIIGLMIVISALSYPLAVVFVKEDYKYKSLVNISIKLIFLVALLVSTILLTMSYQFSFSFNSIVNLICLAILPASLATLYSQVLLRQKKFKIIAYIGLVSAIAVATTKLLAGIYYPTSSALIISTILGFCISAFIMHIMIFGYTLPVKKLTLNSSELSIMKEFKQFPLYRLPHGFITALSQLVPVALLTSYFGLKVAGYFVLTRAVLMVPVTLVGKAVFDVTYPKLSSDFGTKPIAKFILMTTVSLMLISSVPLAVLVIWGPELFSWVFGAEWERAGLYAGYMSFWFAFNLSNRPSVAAIPILGMDKFLLLNGVVSLCISVLSFIAATYIWGTDTAAILSFFSSAIVFQTFLIIKVNIAANKSDKRLFPNGKQII